VRYSAKLCSRYKTLNVPLAVGARQAAAYQIVTGRANEKVPPTLPKDTSAALLAYYKELFVHNLKFYNDSVVAPRLKAQKQLAEATAAVHKEIDQAEAGEFAL